MDWKVRALLCGWALSAFVRGSWLSQYHVALSGTLPPLSALPFVPSFRITLRLGNTNNSSHNIVLFSVGSIAGDHSVTPSAKSFLRIYYFLIWYTSVRTILSSLARIKKSPSSSCFTILIKLPLINRLLKTISKNIPLAFLSVCFVDEFVYFVTQCLLEATATLSGINLNQMVGDVASDPLIYDAICCICQEPFRVPERGDDHTSSTIPSPCPLSFTQMFSRWLAPTSFIDNYADSLPYSFCTQSHKHASHQSCMTQWYKSGQILSSKCPICRSNLRISKQSRVQNFIDMLSTNTYWIGMIERAIFTSSSFLFFYVLSWIVMGRQKSIYKYTSIKGPN